VTEHNDSSSAWQLLFVAVTVASCSLGGCGPNIRQFNGSFTLGLEGWEVSPPGRAAVVGEDRVLNLAMMSAEKVRLLKMAPLDPETELVKISFKVRYQRGSVPWTKQQHPGFDLVLQQPRISGDEGYTSAR